MDLSWAGSAPQKGEGGDRREKFRPRVSSRWRKPSRSIRRLLTDDGLDLVRQPPIAPSTRLYSARIVACSMQFPLREKIAGEIALSDQPGKTMRKWREEMRISHNQPAAHMPAAPPAIFHYET